MIERSIFHRNRRLATAVCLAGLYAGTSGNLQAGEVQVSRYSLLTTTPTVAQQDLLEVQVIIPFPERIRSVGDAIDHLLPRSGYRLAGVEVMDPDTVSLLEQSLPAVHRVLGPTSLREALQVLAGPAYRLVEDPSHRLISFERCTLPWETVPEGGDHIMAEEITDAH